MPKPDHFSVNKSCFYCDFYYTKKVDDGIKFYCHKYEFEINHIASFRSICEDFETTSIIDWLKK